MLKFMEDPYQGVSDFVVHARGALERRLGLDVASQKVAEGDVWKTAAGGLSFNRLVETSKNPEPIPNGYALIEQQRLVEDSTRQVLSQLWADLVPKEPVTDREMTLNALWNVSIRFRLPFHNEYRVHRFCSPHCPTGRRTLPPVWIQTPGSPQTSRGWIIHSDDFYLHR